MPSSNPPLPSTPLSVYAKRRAKLCTIIGDGSIAILNTAKEAIRSQDTHFPYRFDSHFWYLTGFSEPNATIILSGGNKQKGEPPKSILFCREKNPEFETWEGVCYGPDAAKEIFGFDQALPIGSLNENLPELLANHQTLWHTLGLDPDWDAKLAMELTKQRSQARKGISIPSNIQDLRAKIDAMRQIKDKHELDILQRAAKISSIAHERAMRACHTEMTEYQLEAEISYTFRYNGAQGHAYTPIVAGGRNACTLHYVQNSQTLPDHGLVLIDAGCELEGYAADITRTFPVNGRFSAAQRDCYEIVLAAQNAAIEVLSPNADFDDFHKAAVRVLTQGMIDLKLLAGSVDGNIESGAYKSFYMHRTGHWLGLDVHDVGNYSSETKIQKLQPGMVLTVEPGLYIRAGEKNVPPALENIGIRIEDDVYINKTGAVVYSDAPKSISEIEAIMQSD